MIMPAEEMIGIGVAVCRRRRICARRSAARREQACASRARVSSLSLSGLTRLDVRSMKGRKIHSINSIFFDFDVVITILCEIGDCSLLISLCLSRMRCVV